MSAIGLMACLLGLEGPVALETVALAQPNGPANNGPANIGQAALSPEMQARVLQLKTRGAEAFQGLDYGRALEAYTEAYALSKETSLLYNRAMALRALGDYVASLALFEEFSIKATPELRAKVPKLDDLLTDVRHHVGQMRIACNVAGAAILVNGRNAGTAPLAKELPVTTGLATVEIVAAGYASWRRSVQVQSGMLASVEAKLEPLQDAARPTGILSVRSNPGGAVLFLDGSRVGMVPFEASFPVGSHAVVAHKDGFVPFDTRVILVAGERKELDVTLTKQPGFWTRWWFWTGVAVVAAGVGGVVYAVNTEAKPEAGSLGIVRAGGGSP